MSKINSKILDSDKFNKTMCAFDEANAKDPNNKELIYAQRMTDCLNNYDPDASEALQLAVRCQHIRRWEKPRSEYPEGKAGYYKWRTNLYKYHGDVAAKYMIQEGYDKEMVNRVKTLLLKKEIKSNEESQALEDVVCLVFLKYYFDDFITKHDENKLIVIVQKTWGKMSEKAHELALSIDFSDSAKSIVAKALAD